MFLAWYDTVSQDLDMGTFADTNELAVAVPSPTVPAATGAASAPTGTCAPKGSAATIEAPAGAAGTGFKETCLAVAARKPWTVTFNNQDTGVPHDWALYQDSGYTKSIVVGDTITGPGQGVDQGRRARRRAPTTTGATSTRPS